MIGQDGSAQQRTAAAGTRNRHWKKAAVFLVAAAAATAGYVLFGDQLTLQNLARQEAALRSFQQDHPVLVYAIAFAVYCAVTGLSLPGAAALSLLYGWYFGVWRALILVSFASTSGATLAFLLSRFLFRDFVRRRFGERLERFDQALAREGAFFLFTLRLVPYVPFFVINAVMGLTPIRTWTFWWVSQLGMLPGTIVYVYAGSSVPSLQSLATKGIHAVFTPRQLAEIFIAFSLLGVFPLIVRSVVRIVSSKRGGGTDALPEKE